MTPVAVVTGASSGIGYATAARLAADGFDVVACARRLDRLERLAEEVGCRPVRLDVTDDESVAALAATVDRCSVLVNNAGGAFDKDRVESADLSSWQRMYDTNVLGTFRVTRALLPALLASGDGRIVVVTSITGRATYPGGGGYAVAKHGQVALTATLRAELLGRPVQVIEIAPGMVRTDFGLVRNGGDEAQDAATYAGVDPLTAADIADCTAWAVTRPAHVNVDLLRVLPRDQLSSLVVHRRLG